MSAEQTNPTQAEIEQGMVDRANEFHKKVAKLERTKIVSPETFTIRYSPLVYGDGVHIVSDQKP